MRPDIQPRFRSDVDLVTLDVCVKDADGRFISGLSPDDFVVLEEGTRQRIALFEASDPLPMNVVLLIDRSASMRGEKLGRARAAAAAFVRLLGPRDRMKVIAFNERATIISSPAADAWSDALAPLTPTGATALYDAMVLAAHELGRIRRASDHLTARDVIIVLSDGEDTASLVGFEEMLPRLRRSGALVYGLSLRAGRNGQPTGAPWPLLRLAHETGATAMSVAELAQLDRLYEQIAVEVRHMYRIGYVSSDPRADGEWRTLSVRVADPRARIRTRAGYYARPLQ